MNAALRVVLGIVGAAIGENLAAGSRLFGAVLGALAGLGISEVISLRESLEQLRAQLREITQAIGQRGAGETERAPTPEQPSAPPESKTLPVASVSAPPEASPTFKFLREYFTGGNTLVRAGVVVLFFGVAFLLRYLAEHSHLPIELRLTAVACGALVLLVLGWRLRSRRLGYALALQGGAIGILYLTVFSALRLYALLTPATAFALLAALSALSATLAVLQGSMAVALLGVTGGFLAPFLASSGTGSHVALFSYFLVLNGVIAGIAWFRSWRPLNLAGFGFTFVLASVWGVLQYRPQDFASTEPFLAVFFLLYVAIAVLYSTRQAPTLHGYIDGTIIFGTPIAAFGLQAAMLQEQRLALAYSALAVSALYIALAWLLHLRRGERQRLLVEASTALGVAFLTLAVPLALNGRWSAASWALEGAALIWVGCRQNRRLPRAFGALLQLAAGAALALTVTSGSVPAGSYVAGLMVGIASVYAARILHAHKAQLADYERSFPALLFLWGVPWWCIGGLRGIEQHIARSYVPACALVFATITALLASEFVRRFRMRIALLPAFALLPVMVELALWSAASLHHPLAQGGWIAWPLAFVGFYLIAHRLDEALIEPLANTLHALAVWLLAALVSWELAWIIKQAVGNSGAWSVIAWAMVPAILLGALTSAAADVRWLRWPLQVHRTAYLVWASAGLALYLGLWSLISNWQVSSPSAPLPYLPLLNPLDLVQAFALFVLVRFWRRERSGQQPELIALSLLGFIGLNAVLLRTLHQWARIPYELHAMLASTLVQAALSIFWAVLALTTMLIATRVRSRVLWLTGAALLVLVVLKLFVVDLSSIGTIERIVSFVGVGLLMLVVGYFSPMPPAAEKTS
jgi:uncharacterized membrane protein